MLEAILDRPLKCLPLHKIPPLSIELFQGYAYTPAPYVHYICGMIVYKCGHNQSLFPFSAVWLAAQDYQNELFKVTASVEWPSTNAIL